MRFQTHALENLFCPVVRHLCFPFVPPSDLWVTQTNGTSSTDSAFVTKALDFHSCALPEHFEVQSLGPYLFSTKVASSAVGFLLCRIGVFALDGVIFHIHDDEQTALADRQKFKHSLNAAVQVGPVKLDRTRLNQNLGRIAGLGSDKKLRGWRWVPKNLNVKAKHACYRCLATDHLIAECRDPITCSSCRRTGHKSFQCKKNCIVTQPCLLSPPIPPLAPSAPNLPPPLAPPLMLPCSPRATNKAQINNSSSTPSSPGSPRTPPPFSNSPVVQHFLPLPWYGTGGVPLEEPAIDEGGPEDAAATGGRPSQLLKG